LRLLPTRCLSPRHCTVAGESGDEGGGIGLLIDGSLALESQFAEAQRFLLLLLHILDRKQLGRDRVRLGLDVDQQLITHVGNLLAFKRPLDESDRHTIPPKPPRAANAVEVRVVRGRQLEIHDQIDALHVDAPRCQIRRHQHAEFKRPQTRDRGETLLLRQIPADKLRREAELFQQMRHALSQDAAVGEDHALVEGCRFKYLHCTGAMCVCVR